MGMQLSCLLLLCRVCTYRWRLAMDRNLRRVQAIWKEKLKFNFLMNKLGNFVTNYFGGLWSETTHVDRPQNGANSHVLPGSTVAQRVLAKHIPGKSKNK